MKFGEQNIPINVRRAAKFRVWQNLRAVLKTNKPSCFYSFNIEEVICFMCFCTAMPLMWHPIISWKDQGFDSNMSAWFHIHPKHICTCNFQSADLHGSIKGPFHRAETELFESCILKWLKIHQIHRQTVDSIIDPTTKWWQLFVFTRTEGHHFSLLSCPQWCRRSHQRAKW